MKALARLKRARGQLDGLIKMLEDDKYCGDIITQLLALRGALNGIAPLVVESHLITCGEKSLTSKDESKKRKFIKDIVNVCDLSSR